MLLTLSMLVAQYTTTYASPDSPLHSTTSEHSSSYCKDGVPQRVLPSVRVVVSLTCILSMIGASLIILSYFLIRDIRTKAREVLVNLSLMDFMAAAANLSGVLANFNQYYEKDSNMSNHTKHVIDNLCVAQASFAMYGTVSSVLWTICLAVYVYLRIMFDGKDIAKKSVYVLYVICYGIPLGLTLWFIGTDRLGYAPLGGSGWCSVKLKKHKTTANIFALVFGNELWLYLTVILVPLIFISLRFHLKNKMKSGRAILTKNLSSSVQSVEIKLLVIPIFFILLRIWSLVFEIIEVEAGHTLSCDAVLFFLHIGGIGDSGQGFANAILFVLFTPKVRQFYVSSLLRCLRFCCIHRKRRAESINHKGRSGVCYGTVEGTDVSDKEPSSLVFSRSGSQASENERRSLLLNTAP